MLFRSELERLPVEAVVLVEARILGGDDRVLQIGRDLAEGDEFVVFAIGRAVHPGLHAALEVHSGRRRVDPPGGHKEQRGERPKNHHSDEEPSNHGAEEALPRRGSGDSILPCGHIPEYWLGLIRRTRRQHEGYFHPEIGDYC